MNFLHALYFRSNNRVISCDMTINFCVYSLEAIKVWINRRKIRREAGMYFDGNNICK